MSTIRLKSSSLTEVCTYALASLQVVSVGQLETSISCGKIIEFS